MAKKRKKLEKHLSLDLFKPGKITVYVYVIVICLIIGFAILSFVSSLNKTDKYKTQAIDDCIALCNEKLIRTELSSTGPCLSESIAPGWVCDSVNTPRNDYVDNLKENQCESYHSRINKRFVEVSTTCEFLRTN
ncbi:MAG TPA: hypothetical protein PLK55_03355 [archaeon]|jgi:hypothetical protein|nr:hypothetical protein [archaeon]